MQVELDYYDDTEFTHLQNSNLPDFVKESQLKPRENHDRYAVEIMTKEGDVQKRFPIDDEASTWMSARYFEENHNNLTKSAKATVAANIKEAAKRYNIKIAAEALNEYADDPQSNFVISEENAIDEGNVEKESSPENYALPHKNSYPIDNKEQVKEASSYFSKYAREFTLDDRRKFAQNLEKRASDLGVNISNSDIKRYSKENKDENFLKLAMEARKEYVNDDNEDTLDVIMQKQSNFPNSMLVDIIEEFDKTAGIDHLWDNTIPDPDQTVKGNFEKQAEPQDTAVTYNGEAVTSDDIKQISNDKLKQHFDETQVQELKNNPIDVFKALPDPHKEIIIDLI